MQVSIIIPTYNRVKDLEETLDSIIIQTRLPKEVIVVDNANNIETENLIKRRRKDFEKRNVILKYIRSEENSLTVAKNIGIKHSTGDIISFVDDDVILNRRYYEAILKVYEENPNASGVQGLIQVEDVRKENGLISFILSRFNKLFYFESIEKNRCRLFPTTYGTYPLFIDKGKIINCEWLMGASTYKRDIFKEFKFDENLKKYSHKEDKDFSYRIFKKYPHSLFLTSDAKYIHKVSQEARLPERELIYMRKVYSLYLFYKDIDQNIKNNLIFIWSWTGFLIMDTAILIGSFLLKGSKSKLITVKYTIGAYITCMKHLKEIKKGDLEFFK